VHDTTTKERDLLDSCHHALIPTRKVAGTSHSVTVQCSKALESKLDSTGFNEKRHQGNDSLHGLVQQPLPPLLPHLHHRCPQQADSGPTA